MEKGAIESEEFFRKLDDVYQQPGHLMQCKLELVASLVQPGGWLLDIGSGTGEALVRLREHFEHVVGVDASAAAMAYASKKINDRKSVTLIRGSAFRPSLRNGMFDCCLLLDVIEHLEQPGLALSQAAAVLRTGGQLIVSVPNWTNWITARFLGLNPEHRTFYTPSGWKQLIERYGFRVHSYQAVRLPFLKNDIWAKKLPYLGMCIVFNAECLAVE